MMVEMQDHATEITAGERFEFGKNWSRFLSVLDEERIAEAERSLEQMLGLADLTGKTFLDIGSGSGLFSLAARRRGARVRSFDYDPQSVACTAELRRRYFAGDDSWNLEEGSVLDEEYIASLGRFDIVYSWGVLHHTGDMWRALDHAQVAVKPGGLLFIAIYNDQGPKSAIWKKIKKTYCSGLTGKIAMVTSVFSLFALYGLLTDLVLLRNPLGRYTGYKKKGRGMSFYHDFIDWLGGYPFEVAKPEEIFDFFTMKGFRLQRMTTTNGLGTNQFVFQRENACDRIAREN
jgi:2-polyprenyl-6-hydroxyphenyl methylase/3-demethylubiquinone-9 3-methyltransferase